MRSTTPYPTALSNLRDVGGLPTADGSRTRSGVLWRADAPLEGDTTVGPDGAPWPPPSVVDLRSPGELRAPHPLAALGATVTPLPIIEALAPDAQGPAPDAELHIEGLYHRMLDGAEAWLPELVTVVAHAAGPVLVHCAAGKDRTGVTVALLLRAAGVPRDEVAADFAETNRHRGALRERLVAQRALHPDDGEIGVVPAHLEEILDRLEDPWALARGAGVPEDDLRAWRARLLGAA